VILVHAAREPEGRAQRGLQEAGIGGIGGHARGEGREAAEILVKLAEQALRLRPLRDQLRVARRGADLQPRRDVADDALVAGHLVRHRRADDAEFLRIVDHAGLQPAKLAAELLHAGIDHRAGRHQPRDAGGQRGGIGRGGGGVEPLAWPREVLAGGEGEDEAGRESQAGGGARP
jgi:hypothetical protein